QHQPLLLVQALQARLLQQVVTDRQQIQFSPLQVLQQLCGVRNAEQGDAGNIKTSLKITLTGAPPVFQALKDQAVCMFDTAYPVGAGYRFWLPVNVLWPLLLRIKMRGQWAQGGYFFHGLLKGWVQMQGDLMVVKKFSPLDSLLYTLALPVSTVCGIGQKAVSKGNITVGNRLTIRPAGCRVDLQVQNAVPFIGSPVAGQHGQPALVTRMACQ